MGKKSVPVTQSKATLGNQIRSIADRLKQETEVQIKATSRILDAAAQISQNHERLINEVVEMVEEDLEQESQIYNVDILKQQFKTLREAKGHFNLKVNSWEALANKLNEPSLQECFLEQKHPSDAIRKEEHGHKKIEKITVGLQPDVAEIFPTEEAVNEALRFLIRITNKHLD